MLGAHTAGQATTLSMLSSSSWSSRHCDQSLPRRLRRSGSPGNTKHDLLRFTASLPRRGKKTTTPNPKLTVAPRCRSAEVALALRKLEHKSGDICLRNPQTAQNGQVLSRCHVTDLVRCAHFRSSVRCMHGDRCLCVFTFCHSLYYRPFLVTAG
jgi:hypothetical protein